MVSKLRNIYSTDLLKTYYLANQKQQRFIIFVYKVILKTVTNVAYSQEFVFVLL